MKKTTIIKGRIILNNDIPPAFMAISSFFSPKLPKVMMDASNTESGSAIGTQLAEA